MDPNPQFLHLGQTRVKEGVRPLSHTHLVRVGHPRAHTPSTPFDTRVRIAAVPSHLVRVGHPRAQTP